MFAKQGMEYAVKSMKYAECNYEMYTLHHALWVNHVCLTFRHITKNPNWCPNFHLWQNKTRSPPLSMTDWLQFSHIYNEQNQIRNSCLDLLSNLSVSNSGSRVPWQLKKCLTDFYRECKRVPLTWTPNDVPLSAKCVNFCLASLRPCACATSDRLFIWDDAVEFAPLLLWFVDLTLYFAPLL